jgi:hypothetical protein
MSWADRLTAPSLGAGSRMTSVWSFELSRSMSVEIAARARSLPPREVARAFENLRPTGRADGVEDAQEIGRLGLVGSGARRHLGRTTERGFWAAPTT